MAVMIVALVAAMLDPVVSIEAKARPLSEVVAELGTLTGNDLKCSRQLENEIMLLRIAKRPVEEVMRKVATVLDAEWRDDGDRRILVRADKRNRELLDVERSLKRAEAQKTLDQIAATVSKTPSPQSRFEALRAKVAADPDDFDGPWVQGPAGFWVGKMALAIRPDDLASIPDASSIVFATDANRLQREMSAGMQVSLRSMLAEVRDLLEASLSDERTRTYVEARAKKDALERVDKCLLTVTRMGRGWMFWMAAYDAQGKEMLHGFHSSYQAGVDPYEEANRLAAGAKERWVDLSPLVAELERIRDPNPQYSLPPEATRRAIPSEPLRKALLDPEHVDPLSLWTSEALLALAEGRDVCIRIPDTVEMAMRSCLSTGRVNVEKLRIVAEPVGRLSLDWTTDWMTGKPANPIACETSRFSRTALGRFLRANAASGKETLDALARYFFEAGPLVKRFGFWTGYRRNFRVFGVTEYPQWGSYPYEVLAFLGSLSQSERATIVAGNPLRLGATAGRRRELFQGVIRTAQLKGLDTSLTDLMENPTEWMAQVRSDDSQIGLELASQQVLGYPLDGLVLGAQTRWEEPENVGAAYRASLSLDLDAIGPMRIGERRVLILRVEPHPALAGEFTFQLDLSMADTAHPIREMPDAILQRIQAGYSKARREFIGSGGG